MKEIETGIDLPTERQREAAGRAGSGERWDRAANGDAALRVAANYRADEAFQPRTGKGIMMRGSIAAVAGVLALVAAAPASAELGEPFAEATAECRGYATTPEGGSYAPGGQRTSSGVVPDRHVLPLVLVDGTPGGNADFMHSTGETGLWETYWGEATVSFFREHHTIEPGWRAIVGADCGASSMPYTVRARWYDRPAELPATFSATGSSVIGFQAKEAGRFVADVVPPGPGFKVAIRTHCTGEYCDPAWHEDVNRSATFDAPGRFRLGFLSAGPHNLVVANGAAANVRATGTWQVTIRRARDAQPPLPEPPVVQGPTLTDPPPTDNGDPRPRVPQPPCDRAPPPRPTVQVGPDGPRVSADRTPPRYRLTGSRRGRRLRLLLRVYETAIITVRLESGGRKTTIRRQLARNQALVVRRTTRTRRAGILVRLVDRAGNTRRVARTY